MDNFTFSLLFVDSDAIILDFGLDVAELGRSYPDADLIVSADIRLGLINSGVLILRNTEWSRALLDAWWQVANRTKVCDQDAFDLLYRQWTTEEKKKVKLLATDALNSHPPAWKHIADHNAVLHLMGESAALRAQVFRKAFLFVCAARSGGMLQKQLGIDRQFIQDKAREIYRNQTQEAFNKANQTGQSEDMQQLSLASHRYVDILSCQMDQLVTASAEKKQTVTNKLVREKDRKKLFNEVLNIREAVFKLLLHRVEEVKLEVKKINPSDRYVLLNELVTLMKQAAEAGNALFWSVHLVEDRQQVGRITLEVLEQLLSLVDQQSTPPVHHMEALMHQNLGVILYEEVSRLMGKDGQAVTELKDERIMWSYLNQSLFHLEMSVQLFDRYLVDSSDGSARMEHLHSLEMLAGTLCLIETKPVVEVKNVWWKAITKARKNVGGLRIGVDFERLALVLYNAALCYTNRKMDKQEIVSLLQEAVSIFEIIHKGKQEFSSLSVEAKNIEKLLENARHLLMTIRGEYETKTNENKEKSLRTMRVIDSEEGRKYVPVEAVPTTTGGVTTVASEEEEEEWEECPEDDLQGCEDFLVVESSSQEEVNRQRDGVRTTKTEELSSKENSAPYDELSIYLDLSPKEIEELRIIRNQYQEVIKRQTIYREQNDFLEVFSMQWIMEEEEEEIRATSNTTNLTPSASASTSTITSTSIKPSCEDEASLQVASLKKELKGCREENERLREQLVSNLFSLFQHILSHLGFRVFSL
eukprot:scaffold644_cov168-Ochromonas_danica.AAC.35